MSNHGNTWRNLECASLNGRSQSERLYTIWFHKTFWKMQNYGGSGCQGLRKGMTRQSTEAFRAVKLLCMIL